MPIGAIIAGVSLGAKVLGGIGKRRRRRRDAKRQKHELQKQKAALEARKKFEIGRATEAGAEFQSQSQVQSAISGVAGGAGTSTQLGFEASEKNIQEDIKQLGINFDQRLSALDSDIGAARSAEKVSFGDALGFIGDVAGGAAGIAKAGGFSGLKNIGRGRNLRRNPLLDPQSNLARIH